MVDYGFMGIITHHTSGSHAIESNVVLFRAPTEGGRLVHLSIVYYTVWTPESEFDTIYLGELLTLTLTFGKLSVIGSFTLFV